jgi:hypothetical protein
MRAESGNRKTHEPARPVGNALALSPLTVRATDHRSLITDNCFFPTPHSRFPTAFFTRRLP